MKNIAIAQDMHRIESRRTGTRGSCHSMFPYRPVHFPPFE